MEQKINGATARVQSLEQIVRFFLTWHKNNVKVKTKDTANDKIPFISK